MAAATREPPSLLHLPDELLQHILTFVTPVDLARVAVTCHRLCTHSYDDRIWKPIVEDNTLETLHAPTPCESFRDLYLSHHPHWFVSRNRIWFADSEPSGKLLISRYNAEKGSIEAYTVVGHMSRDPEFSFWEKNNEVVIHSFEPKVSLDLNQPVLKLQVDSPMTEDQPNSYPSDREYAPSSIYSKEILMDTFADAGIFSSFMLCRALPEIAISEGTRVWPPLRLPSVTRTRNVTSDGYNSAGHRPNRLDEISECNFRVRKWAEYTGRRSSPSLFAFSAGGLPAAIGVGGPYFAGGFAGGGISYRMPEDIITYATLPASAYTPTPTKPWQGIWVGDYSGHGCEFMVIRQPDERDEKPLPSNMNWLRPWFRGDRRRGSVSSVSSWASAASEMDHSETGRLQAASARLQAAREVLQQMLAAEDPTGQEQLPIFNPVQTSAHEETDYADAPTGRLEAIKLTGDPNIPRGEYTFIAPDIGHRGFLRVADEKIFKGARVVRAAGHVAARGFREDQYTPSHLIMISHNRLAQFWEAFGHISFYERVDLDELIKYNA